MGPCRSNRTTRRRPNGRRSVRRSVGRWTPGRRRRTKKLWGRNASTWLWQYVHVISHILTCRAHYTIMLYIFCFAKGYIKNWDVMGNHILLKQKTEGVPICDNVIKLSTLYSFAVHHNAVQYSNYFYVKTGPQKIVLFWKKV